MDENVASVSADHSEDPLWFMTENDHEFKAEGFVRRIPGTTGRVQFNGMCILKDAPDRKIKVNGVAKVNLSARSQNDSAGEEAVEADRRARRASQASEEEGEIAQLADDMVRRVEEAIDRGHVVVERGGAVGISPVRDESNVRAQSEPSSDEDQRRTPDDQGTFERVNRAIDQGHVIVRRGVAVESSLDGEDANFGKRVERAGPAPILDEDQRIDDFDQRWAPKIQGPFNLGNVVFGPYDDGREDGENEYETEESNGSERSSSIHAITLTDVSSDEEQEQGRREASGEEPRLSFFSPNRPINRTGSDDQAPIDSSPSPRQVDYSPEEDAQSDHPEEVSPLRPRQRGAPAEERQPDDENQIPMPKSVFRSALASEEESPPDDRPGPSRVQIEVEEVYLPSDVSLTTSSASSEEEVWVGSSAERSARGLIFPKRQVKRHLADEAHGGVTVGQDAAIFAGSVVETLIRRLLISAGEKAHEEVREHITQQDIAEAANEDYELRELLKSVVIPKSPLPSRD